MALPFPFSGGDDAAGGQSEDLMQASHASPPQIAGFVREVRGGDGDGENTNLAGSGDSYQCETQGASLATVQGQPSSGTTGWEERNVQLGTREQDPPSPAVHSVRPYRRNRIRRQGRQFTAPRVEYQSDAQFGTRVQHRPADGPQTESVVGGGLEMGLSDEERRVLAEFDAAVRQIRSARGPSSRQGQEVGFRFGFGID